MIHIYMIIFTWHDIYGIYILRIRKFYIYLFNDYRGYYVTID